MESAGTGTVSVALESGEPAYTIHEGAAWDFISLTDAQLADVGKQDWDIFYFGTLAQRSNVSRKNPRRASADHTRGTPLLRC